MIKIVGFLERVAFLLAVSACLPALAWSAPAAGKLPDCHTITVTVDRAKGEATENTGGDDIGGGKKPDGGIIIPGDLGGKTEPPVVPSGGIKIGDGKKEPPAKPAGGGGSSLPYCHTITVTVDRAKGETTEKTGDDDTGGGEKPDGGIIIPGDPVDKTELPVVPSGGIKIGSGDKESIASDTPHHIRFRIETGVFTMPRFENQCIDSAFAKFRNICLTPPTDTDLQEKALKLSMKMNRLADDFARFQKRSNRGAARFIEKKWRKLNEQYKKQIDAIKKHRVDFQLCQKDAEKKAKALCDEQISKRANEFRDVINLETGNDLGSISGFEITGGQDTPSSSDAGGIESLPFIQGFVNTLGNLFSAIDECGCGTMYKQFLRLTIIAKKPLTQDQERQKKILIEQITNCLKQCEERKKSDKKAGLELPDLGRHLLDCPDCGVDLVQVTHRTGNDPFDPTDPIAGGDTVNPPAVITPPPAVITPPPAVITPPPVVITPPPVADATPPVVTAPFPITVLLQSFVGSSETNGAPVSNAAIQAFLNGATATDNVGVVGGITNNAPAGFIPVKPFTVIFNSNLNSRKTTVTFTARDAAGNVGTATSTILVADFSGPGTNASGSCFPAAIHVPLGSIVPVTHPGLQTYINCVKNSFSDNVDGPIPAASVQVYGDPDLNPRPSRINPPFVLPPAVFAAPTVIVPPSVNAVSHPGIFFMAVDQAGNLGYFGSFALTIFSP